MTVRKLLPQKAEHVESGITLGGAGWEAMRLSHGERTMTILVERGDHRKLYYLLANPTWDDGTPVDPGVAATLRPVITEIEHFWESTAEFRTTSP